MIYIDELTEPEAREYIVALGLELSEIDIDYCRNESSCSEKYA